MERALFIEKYRNLGIEEPQRLVLNYSLKKGEMGNLVIVIGPNNSGKSNVLDALSTFYNKNFFSHDITDLTFKKEERIIKLTLKYKGDTNKDCYSFELHDNDYLAIGPKIVEPSVSKQILLEVLNKFRMTCIDNSFRTCLDIVDKYISLLSASDEKSNKYDVANSFITDIKKVSNNVYLYFKQQFLTVSALKPLLGTATGNDAVIDQFVSKYGYNPLPRILKYVEKPLSQKDLNIEVSNIFNSKFIDIIADKIKFDKTYFAELYKNYSSSGNAGVLTKAEKKINQALKVLSKDFNRLYFTDDYKYSFEVKLFENKISFYVNRGNDTTLNLAYQSTGFKWFFNLYFGLLCKTTLVAGDILIMDEPATNLHVNGQRELRKFLKEFAKENDVTIVIATHSPFLVDIDELDELRTVNSNKTGSASIYNEFSSYDPEDSDNLKPIKNALTIENHIILNPDNYLVFVEGITDYNYLNAFKKILKNYDNVNFLPISGVGNIKDDNIKQKQIEISKSLLNIKKSKCVLLTDSDKAGLSMKEVNEKDSDLTVVTLSDIDKDFKIIEDLFSTGDIANFGLKNSDGSLVKHASLSSLIKNNIEKYKFEETTISNFKKLFDYLVS